MSYDPTSVFCFLDESGVLHSKSNSSHWGLGLIIHPRPDEIIEKLHSHFEALCSVLNKDPSRLEFHFENITEKSLPLYLKCIDSLMEDKQWRFACFYIDLVEQSNFNRPTDKLEIWKCYLRWVKILLQKKLTANENGILIADYYNRPSGITHSFATLPSVVSQLRDVLQVESQGVLLVQMADVLLGGTLYKGSDIYKKPLADKIKYMRNNLENQRFNVWKANFN